MVWLVPRHQLRDGYARLGLLVTSVSAGRAERIDLHAKGTVSVQEIDGR